MVAAGQTLLGLQFAMQTSFLDGFQSFAWLEYYVHTVHTAIIAIGNTFFSIANGIATLLFCSIEFDIAILLGAIFTNTK